MGSIEPGRLLERLAAGSWRLSVVATGGGSGAISALCGTAGASRVVVEGLVPYAREAIDRLLGGRQEQYCSDRAARRLATIGWQRSAAVATPGRAVGAAVTASLATLEPKRGGHRVHAAVQTASATYVASVELVKGARDRREEEEVAAALLLSLVHFATASPAMRDDEPLCGMALRDVESVARATVRASAPLESLFKGDARLIRGAVSSEGGERAEEPRPGALIFPGSFDPLHEGHRLMARIAEEIAEEPVAFELSIRNVDKPMLDFAEIRRRTAQFPASSTLWLSRAATFVEKTSVFPQATFVMGADTYKRLGDPRYYGGSRETAEAAVRSIAAAIRGLVVFGRAVDGSFEDASRIDAPAALREKTYFVSQREFRMDVSSTDIRRRTQACGDT